MLTIDNNVIKCPFLTSSLAISPRPDGLAGDQIHWQANEILKKELEIHVPIEGGRQQSSICFRSSALSSKSRTSFSSHTELYNLAVRFDLQEDSLQSRKARIT